MSSKIIFIYLLILLSTAYAQPGLIKNTWATPPRHIPNNVSIDAPLMGNGDVTMSVGIKGNNLRYYLSKNDFWRLRSQGDGLSGPRVVAYVDIKIDGFENAGFSAEQLLKNGITNCILKNVNSSIEVKSWVSATENLLFIELNTIDKPAKISVQLNAPENKQAELKTGESGGIYWLTRAFADSIDIPTEVAVALKTINYPGNTIALEPGKKLFIAMSVESRFKNKQPLEYVTSRVKKINNNSLEPFIKTHNQWWDSYWNKSTIYIDDTVLMKAYYQGLYTMAACSRDKKFPPGIFGWTTTDRPGWNGDYHLNYNFQAPFYSLYAANRLEQATPHDAPLLDFIPRGEWYAKNVTNTRGVLYPVGIGPMGIEVTRNFPNDNYQKGGNIEQEGLFFKQRSNAAYGIVNMAQHWRTTYDKKYGEKIYPYVLAVANFWEDYLKFEDGRYVIYGDAIHEGSGKDKNPILSLGLIRNLFDLVIDLSASLKINENRQAKWNDILTKLSEFPVQTRNGRKVFRYTEEGVSWWNDNGLGIQHIYPSNAIGPDSKPELLSVAHNTVDEMRRWQDNNTSSSFFVAAIRVGYNPSVIMRELNKYALHTYPNGFQLNNPHGIENSCTVANALNEMLCMSVGNVIRLFPGFNKEQDAVFTNIRAWGAFLISAQLKNGVVSNFEIRSEKGRVCTIVNPWPGKSVQIIRNGKVAEWVSGERFTIRTILNEVIELKPKTHPELETNYTTFFKKPKLRKGDTRENL